MTKNDVPHQSGGINIEGQTTNIGRDAIGRDAITNKTSIISLISEGGPAARYAIIGVIIIAALAIIALLTSLLTVSSKITPFPLSSTIPLASFCLETYCWM